MSIISKIKVKNVEYDVLDDNYVHTDNNFTTEEKTKLGSLENYDDTEIKQDISDLGTNKADKSEIPDVSDFITKNVDDLTNYYTKTETDNKIPDVSNFITKSVDDLVNYYKKSETYTQTEVNNLISAISTLNLLVVQELPTQDISTTTIYLVPKTTAETNNVYDEYIYVSNNWELIGTTDIDLSDYVTNTQLNTALADYTTTTDLTTLLNGKQDKLTAGTNITIDANNVISASGGSSLNVKVLEFTISRRISANNHVQFELTQDSKTIISNDIIEWEKTVSYGDKQKGLGLPTYILSYNGTKYGIDTNYKTSWKGILQWARTYSFGNSDQIIFGVTLFNNIDNTSYYKNSNGCGTITITYYSSSQTASVESGTGLLTYASYPYSTVGSWSSYSNISQSTYLSTDNTLSYTPSGNYNPATKKYVDDLVGNINTVLATLTTPGGN